MSIPLEHLYHYINQRAQQSWGDRVIIYRFYPHGAKDLKNLSFLDDYPKDGTIITCPHVYCNDQEPLNFERYEQETFRSARDLDTINCVGLPKMNLRDYPEDIWHSAILLHSEQRSKNLQQYIDNKFVPVYYWSHAMIARDWFRGAEYLSTVKTATEKIFLVYNRAWSGTREYRLRFADLLIDNQLDQQCRMTVNAIEPELGIHYQQYNFKNSVWRPIHQLENYFDSNSITSCYSAEFDLDDYACTDIEIVLETLFDDERLHLTEKSLRPIACGQPFILAGTQGSLEYLRQYGFQTYSSVWSEHYDLIEDPEARMKEIVSVMTHISQWSPDERQHKLAQAQEIADFNRQHFFSNNFIKLVVSELETGLDQAFLQLRKNSINQQWLDMLQTPNTFVSLPGSILGQLTPQDRARLVNWALELKSKHVS